MQYYNYFTEVEDRFRLARNSGMFMMSPLDWVLVESWKDAGVPLAAVLKGIDRAFEKYHAAKRRRFSTVNSVAYCTQEVLGAARDMAHGAPVAAQATAPGFEPAALVGRSPSSCAFFEERAEQLRRVASQSTIGSDLFAETARVLDGLAAQAQAHELSDLEDVERRLAALEARLFAAATLTLSADQLVSIRRELDAQLKPYRRKMTAEQLASLEQGYLQRKSLEALGLSRLSLFYLG